MQDGPPKTLRRMPGISPETSEPVSTTGRRRLRPAVLFILFLALAPLLAGFWVVSSRSAEDEAVRRARAHLERGELERSLAVLGAAARRPFLSREARYHAAELYFRLGEDRKAHTLLVGIRYDRQDAGDRRLRELSARCQRAASLVARADREKDPDERLRLIREAQLQLPDSPRLLLRAAEEALRAMTGSRNPQYGEAFQEEYLELRRKAPGLAAGFQRRVEQQVRETL